MPKHTMDATEAAWMDKVCALLEADKKHQWAIGDALLEGEHWFVEGISGKELHDADEAANRRQSGAEDEHTPFRVSIGGHDPFNEVAKRSGYDRSTIQDFMRVSRAFPAGKRQPELTWSHHQACAAKWLTDKQREELLEQALPGRSITGTAMSVGKLRQLVSSKNTDEFAGANGYSSLSVKLPTRHVDKLEKLAKKEKTKVAKLMLEAVELLFEQYTENKKPKKAA